ncbi:amidohydrolase [Shewanella violacea]|uniref:Uncharacterized protein n=1 Tax=Shewanella violacea (strain JCM 10179 / CIP 106290 / LMG 19151 / DSS12) TaxID=637905 RepID=D4ZJ08_SHEVD|nr:amidohydrolase family protein [Shewanella violacea]BAJ01657.1 hypothetical protein SVI_1686 [Shewanella violacea DSS12]
MQTLFTAKKVYAVDEQFIVHNAIVIEDDKILAVGNFEQLSTQFPAATVNTDFAEQYIYPGFIEPHLHFVSTAAMLGGVVPLSFTEWTVGGKVYPGVRDPETYRNKLIEIIAQEADRELLVVWGHYEPLHGEVTMAMLDAICPSQPLCIWGGSIHKVTMNSACVEKFKVNELDDKMFGKLVDDKDQSTGILIEQAMMYICKTQMFPIIATQESLFKGLNDVLTMGRRKGVTTAMDMGIGFTGLETELAILNAADSIPGMPRCRKAYMMNFQSAYTFNDCDHDKAFAFVDEHYRSNQNNPMVIPLRAIKFFADGAVSDYEIMLKEPFKDGRSTGLLYDFEDCNADTMRADMQRYWNKDYNICVHTQGNLAHSMMLDNMFAMQEIKPGRDGQMFIQHLGLTDNDFYERIDKGAVKPCASVTPYYSYHFYTSWKKEDILPDSCYPMMQRARTAIDHGMMVSTNSDIPLMPTNPILATFILMTRLNKEGDVVLGEEAITREEGLRAITSVSAKQHLLDDRIGSLEVGKLADFTVLDFDWMEDDLRLLEELDAHAVFVGGLPA